MKHNTLGAKHYRTLRLLLEEGALTQAQYDAEKAMLDAWPAERAARLLSLVEEGVCSREEYEELTAPDADAWQPVVFLPKE